MDYSKATRLAVKAAERATANERRNAPVQLHYRTNRQHEVAWRSERRRDARKAEARQIRKNLRGVWPPVLPKRELAKYEWPPLLRTAIFS